MKVEVFKREDGLWDWRLVAGNGEVVCGSVQGYTERNDAIEGWRRVAAAIINGVTMA